MLFRSNVYKAPCKQTQHCWPTTPSIVGCYMLRPFAHPVECCWMLLRVVAQRLKPVKLFSQQLPTFLLFCDRRSLAQQCWIRLHSSSNIVGATRAHYACSTKTYGLNPSQDALQVPTLLAQQCWELLRPFARSLKEHEAEIFFPPITSIYWLFSLQRYLLQFRPLITTDTLHK